MSRIHDIKFSTPKIKFVHIFILLLPITVNNLAIYHSKYVHRVNFILIIYKYYVLEMDLQNLENYPVYILNVMPELTEESNVQQPQQMTSGELISYNFYVPNVDHQVPILNAESVPPIVSHTNTTKSIKKLTFDKTIHHLAVKNNQSIELVINVYIVEFFFFKNSNYINDKICILIR